jgi:S-adenosylmethionine:tRNA ribosyltransferase-isomerase
MTLDDLDYALPAELIAQHPAPERTAARLMAVDRATGERRHASVRDLPDLLRPGDLLVVNDARVIPARVRGRRPSGGRIELLLLRAVGGPSCWTALVRGAPRLGERVHFACGTGRFVGAEGEGRWRIELDVGDVPAWLERYGEIPLPPYVRRPAGPEPGDAERYQTVFARTPGAVAAPTAGLHFTPELLAALAAREVRRAALTLHVGPGTFLPIRAARLDDHVMEAERYTIPPETAAAVADTRRAGGRIVAVGTTTVRTLEAAATDDRLVRAGRGEAAIFIRPGHRFRVPDALMTNFHLPRSPLLALVSAFAGWEHVRQAYEDAVERRYRFYSFGDAMLLS